VGLPASIRLRHWKDFQAVYKQGRRYRGTGLLLRVQEDSNQAPSCWGITVSQKVCKQAVGRNRIKRQIRGVILTLLPRFSSGFKVVIVVLPHATLYKYEHFLRELEKLCKQAGIIPYGH
jgi:ribonuclease P protein component